jgi:acetoin utilization protein AcuB
MKVRDFTSRNVVTIGEHASCRDAVALMTRHKIRHLPVMRLDRTLAGIATDRDLRHHLFTPDVFRSIGSVSVESLLSRVPVQAVMSKPVVSIDADAELEEAARRMLEEKLGSLPVLEHGRIVGIITETDLLRRIVGDDGACGDVEAIVVSYP